MTKFRKTLASLAPVLILLAALGLAWGIYNSAPETQPKEEPAPSRIVQTMPLAPSTETIYVSANGIVIPAQKVVMQPEVNGKVIAHHPSLIPGGYVEQGEELIKIDPSEYLLALAEMEAALEEAQFEMDLEAGRQVIASRELELLEDELNQQQINRSLVLREPHLRRAQAMIQKATNEIAKAQLNLQRTSLKAPFNAMVLDESVEIGQQVAPGNTVCTLVGTDAFWVQTSLPQGLLRHIQLPGPNRPGSESTVSLDTGNGSPATWPGRVMRLLSDLEPSGRMARVLIQVSDPLGLSSQSDTLPLLLGSYVDVHIQAGELSNVLAIPRSALREGDRIWVVDQENALRIRPANILWTREETVLIENNVHPGEMLITSGLKAAIPGMKVDPQSPPLRHPEPGLPPPSSEPNAPSPSTAPLSPTTSASSQDTQHGSS